MDQPSSESQNLPRTWEPADLLGRKEIADKLTQYLTKRYAAKKTENGFVVAVNAGWGFGKTYLLQNWAQDLQVQTYPSVYFNAWENDFTPEPLIAFIASINASLKPFFSEVPVAKKLLSQAIKQLDGYWKPAGKALINIGAKKLLSVSIDELQEIFDSESVETDESSDSVEVKSDSSETLEDIKKALKKSIDASLKTHVNKSKAIKEFRKSLERLVDALNKSSKFQLPIFFFIDELDRCRPDYAIELLEGIKHLLGVRGIYFVISTNLAQMGASTQAIYGPDFDGRQYLKRFFDLEYSLPEPDNLSFAKSLFASAAIPKTTICITGLNTVLHGPEIDHTALVFSHYAEYFKLDLRSQQRIMKVLEPCFLSLAEVHIHFLFFLAMLHYKNSDLFENLTGYSGRKPIGTIQEELKLNVGNPTSFVHFSHSRDIRNLGQSNQRVTTFVSISEIVSLYMSSFQQNFDYFMRQQLNQNEFPECLIAKLKEEAYAQQRTKDKFKASIDAYPSLIRHAGQFS